MDQKISSRHDKICQGFQTMKLQELTEATNVNVNIINDIIDQIFNMLPSEIGISTYENAFTIKGQNLNLTNLKTKFPQFEEFFEHITETRFVFLNAPQYENNTTLGLYNSEKNIVIINLSNTMEYYSTHKIEQIIKKSRTNSPYAVLFHEIRHIMQHKDYPDYFTSDKDRKREYTQRDIEIDAAWYNIIAVYDPKKFKPKAYVHRVMDDLNHARTLTPRQKAHYHKKTLKYYTNPEHFDQSPRSKEDILVNKVAKKVSKYLENVGTFDLRNLPNYDSNNFLFPVENVIGSLRKALTFHSTDIILVKNMLYFVPSLYLPKNLAKVWMQYVTKIHGYKLSDALRSFENGMPPNHFDYDAMKDHMKAFFS
jgi:hypothetical protein